MTTPPPKGPSRGRGMRSRYVDIDDRMEDLRELLADLPAIAKDFELRYELSWLHHESGLEGIVVSGPELAMALSNQPLAEATALATHRELRNHRAAFDLVKAEAQAKKLRLNLTLIRRLYEALGEGIEGRSSAEY